MAIRLQKGNDRLRALALVLLFAIPSGAAAQNPFTLSEKDEIELGRHAAGEIEKDIRLVEAPAIVKYVDRIGQSLVQKSTRKEIAYTFKVIDSPEINAFALPGGYIYINRGLIEAAETEDELAGVLAHEIGHVVARHGANQASRAGLVQTGLGALGGSRFFPLRRSCPCSSLTTPRRGRLLGNDASRRGIAGGTERFARNSPLSSLRGWPSAGAAARRSSRASRGISGTTTSTRACTPAPSIPAVTAAPRIAT